MPPPPFNGPAPAEALPPRFPPTHPPTPPFAPSPAPPPPTSPRPLQAFELLELYLELLALRGPLIASTKEIPRDMVEALSSVLYSASRCARGGVGGRGAGAGAGAGRPRRAGRPRGRPTSFMAKAPAPFLVAPAPESRLDPAASPLPPPARLPAEVESRPSSARRRPSLAPRVPDLPELATLHKMFAQKYGKEYVEQASSDANCHRCARSRRGQPLGHAPPAWVGPARPFLGPTPRARWVAPLNPSLLLPYAYARRQRRPFAARHYCCLPTPAPARNPPPFLLQVERERAAAALRRA
jgi:hypothetical protein